VCQKIVDQDKLPVPTSFFFLQGNRFGKSANIVAIEADLTTTCINNSVQISPVISVFTHRVPTLEDAIQIQKTEMSCKDAVDAEIY